MHVISCNHFRGRIPAQYITADALPNARLEVLAIEVNGDTPKAPRRLLRPK